jgi:hypothetical protein
MAMSKAEMLELFRKLDSQKKHDEEDWDVPLFDMLGKVEVEEETKAIVDRYNTAQEMAA